MHPRTPIRWLLILALLAGGIYPVSNGQAFPLQSKPAQSSGVTAYDLIIAMNSLRLSYGLPMLIEDPIINAVAQSTAEIMAANQSSWHIGDVRGRLASAGYGGGATVWGTENFAVGGSLSLDEIMVMWSDESHMIPAVNPAYCHVGAGVAKSGNGMTYYVLQAAYTSGKSCGEYRAPGGNNNQPGGSTNEGRVSTVSQLIVPVKIATPDAEGKLFHMVEAGQSFWAIAVTYKITIKDIETWNNISRDSKLQIGQRLFIPTSNTKGFATPTPVGMIQVSTPDSDGKIIHTVQAYNTLSTISKAYGTPVENILSMNGIQLDWPLQIGQKLIIHPGTATPSPTPRPLTPLERLTPESDGKLYHTIRSGETLSWIAGLYGVPLYDLMVWNGLNASSIIQPDQKLLLQVTIPATETHTPHPPSDTPPPTKAPDTATPTLVPTIEDPPPAETPELPEQGSRIPPAAFLLVGLVSGGLFLFGIFSRKKQ